MKEHLVVMKDPRRRGSSSTIQADRFDHLLGIFITKAGTLRYHPVTPCAHFGIGHALALKACVLH